MRAHGELTNETSFTKTLFYYSGLTNYRVSCANRMRCHVGNGAALLLDTASTADYPSVIRDLFFSRWCRLSSSRLDYGNSTLASVSSHLLSRLQSVMNAATRLIFSSSRFQHITPLLRQLHWLKAPERIAFKHAVLEYKCLHGSAPAYY